MCIVCDFVGQLNSMDFFHSPSSISLSTSDGSGVGEGLKSSVYCRWTD